MIEVNLSSVFRLSKLAGKQMIENGRGGKIVNIASLLSFQGGITVPAYAASKGGVAQLTGARKRVGQTPDQRERDRAGLHAHHQHGSVQLTKHATGRSSSAFPQVAGRTRRRRGRSSFFRQRE